VLSDPVLLFVLLVEACMPSAQVRTERGFALAGQRSCALAWTVRSRAAGNVLLTGPTLL